MKIVAVIPARYQSTRFPGKPLAEICGKPMIWWVYQQVKKVKELNEVYVATDDDRIKALTDACEAGAEVVVTPGFLQETALKAVAGELSDEAVIRKVDTPNEDYILKEEGAVINWFEIDAPAGYLSINDSIGEIWATAKGKLVLLGVAKGLLKKLKSKDGEKKEVAGFDASSVKISPKLINKNTIGMVKGFSIKRVCMMAKSLFTKEELLSINAKLNKIKKPSK